MRIPSGEFHQASSIERVPSIMCKVPVPLCKFHHANSIVQIHGSSLMVRVLWCEFHRVNSIVQISSCKFHRVSILLCEFHRASSIVQLPSCASHRVYSIVGEFHRGQIPSCTNSIVRNCANSIARLPSCNFHRGHPIVRIPLRANPIEYEFYRVISIVRVPLSEFHLAKGWVVGGMAPVAKNRNFFSISFFLSYSNPCACRTIYFKG